MRIAFVDLETTGLDPMRHAVWDIGIVMLHEDGGTTEHQFFPEHVPLENAEPTALRIGRLYERHPCYADLSPGEFALSPGQANKNVALEVARLLDRVIFAGNVVNFDAAFLTQFLRNYGFCPSWHYHLLDVEAFAAGFLGLEPPWNSRVIEEKLQAELEVDRHTAIGDARMAHEVYHSVLSRVNDRVSHAAAVD